MALTGYEILGNPFLNKGTAFSAEERRMYRLEGLLPPHIDTIELQSDRMYAQFKNKETGMEKRLFLMEIYDNNRTLFYYMFSKYLDDFMAVIYNPVIAQSIKNYSRQYMKSGNAIYLSIDSPEAMEEALRNGAEGRRISLIAVTDSESILGIGDWGTNGVDIAIGKLIIYTVASGIDPSTVLPVVLDVGTNREALIDDPLYLGNHHARVSGREYDDFIEQFMVTSQRLFPHSMVHFEDFGRDHAASILKRYYNRYPVFNGDIQGTGVVALAAVLGAMKLTNQNITDQRFLCFGAGASGMGIIDQIYNELIMAGLTDEEAKKRIWLVDKQGLLFEDTEDMTSEQTPYARPAAERSGEASARPVSERKEKEEAWNLERAVNVARPTVLIGASTVGGAFTENIVKAMLGWCDRPVILPLSIPAKISEASAEDLIKWTDGRVLTATGANSNPVEYNGKIYSVPQANNALTYPGLGMGLLVSGASQLTDEMISVAAHAVADMITSGAYDGTIIPPLSDIVEVSRREAAAVLQYVMEKRGTPCTEEEAMEVILSHEWKPEYTV